MNSVFKSFDIVGGEYEETDFLKTSWTGCKISGSKMENTFMSEAKLKKFSLSDVEFTNVDFFKTPLSGVDLSDCSISGLMVSDSFSELKGASMNVEQAAEVARMMGIIIV